MPAPSPWTHFQIAKITIYGLLCLNLLFFALYGSRSEIVENAGWMILIGVFEYETGQPSSEYSARWKAWAVMGAHCTAYLLVLAALVRYVGERDWPNCANAVLWLLVVAVLAYDVYAPGTYGGIEWRIRNGVKISLYAGICGLAVWWGYIGDLLDLWDAALWIVCFLVIELNTFRIEQPGTRPA